MKRRWVKVISFIFLPVFLGACATIPTGPSMAVYPGDGKSQQAFYQDDARCKEVALQRTGISPEQAAVESTVNTAVLGTLLGAAMGLGLGALGGRPGLGAGAGAGSGLFLGTAAGAEAGAASARAVQRRYDAEFQQCMYAAGHRVPGVMQMQAPQAAPPSTLLPPPPPQTQYAPPPPPPAASGAPCKPTGRYVRTPSGFQEICE
ncbi:glycine zipper family protein [Candidatus Parcubacteria bacterium]|nr:glycine zipper family protein [Candidatus Parcubacteria bacterium]MBI4098949.1 glycine zipper family protein [Candidatus Parcubacteria bacterium]MBI4385272.1 glycine zipper family protein [Candidatus Parcubacteria bacterium]